MKRFLFLTPILCLSLFSQSQQVADTSFKPEIVHPRYALNEGPVILVDEGHHNFHTRDGRYQAFAQLIARDGYRVGSHSGSIRESKLRNCRIFVISNALHAANVSNWSKPVRSAFEPEEIEILRKWVQNGGSLFLVADHMPMAGAAKDLAAAFGFTFYDGFALKTTGQGPSEFSRENLTLLDGPMTTGKFPEEYVDKVLSFTGQAFQIPDDALSVMVLDDSHLMLLPDTAWIFHPSTPSIQVGGWSQGAYKTYGEGKVAVFGEAAMFTAQVVLPQNIKAGMNVAGAEQNFQFLLNIIHWLDGVNE